jgi:hypothetical protein
VSSGAPTAVDVGSGQSMHAFMRELFPICRSITGDGVRETLAAVARRIPLELHEVPSGTNVLDWTVPDEWNIEDAYIAKDGRRVVDFRESNLHVVNYSVPVRAVMPLAELRPHLRALPEHPEWPPLARQRQPLGNRAAHGDRRPAPRRAPFALLPAPVHPWDDRVDHLARPKRRTALEHRRRAHPGLRR